MNIPSTEQPSDPQAPQTEEAALAAEAEAQAEAVRAASLQRSIRRTKITFTIIIPICVALGIYIYIQTAPPPNGMYDAFAQCIDHTSTTFYGAWWCPHCAAQKTEFGAAAKYLPYVECAASDTSELASCVAIGIQHYPTWVFPDGSSSTGVQSIATLAKETGCALPTSTL